jgi:phosphatidate cytidylyltransferase
MTGFVSRLLVGAVGLPLVLGLLYLGGWWLFVLAAVVAVLALHEFWTMTRRLRPLALAGYAGVVLALFGAQLGGLDWALAGFLTTLALALLLNGVAETRAPATVAVAATVLAAAWIGLGLAHIVLLRKIPEHAVLASLTVLLAIFASDTFAYFGGRLLGRHRLAPTVSPGKTWEGLAVGSVVAVLVTFLALYEDRDDFLTVWQAIVLGGVIAATAPLGDLFASALKRDMQVKDTGRILAGHGGMLDRLDSILFAAVASYYTIRAFGYA